MNRRQELLQHLTRESIGCGDLSITRETREKPLTGQRKSLCGEMGSELIWENAPLKGEALRTDKTFEQNESLPRH